jgi:hemerythrin-like domain-containing protein
MIGSMHRFLGTLVDEHERILDALAALYDYARFLAPNDEDPRGTLRDFSRFFREYLDGAHHHKEEALLFEAMFDAGFSRTSGPVACMNHEHEDGRAAVAKLSALAEGAGALSPDELASLVEASADFTRLLASHIAKENQMLYPLAARALSDETLDALAERARAAHSLAEIQALEALGEALSARSAAR